MYKRSFSLIEIIFTIAIISILAIVAIPKLNTTLSNTNTIKIKSDIILIRDGLQKYKTKAILSNNTSILEKLDIDNSKLFSKILKYPILSNDSHKIGTWEKLSDSSYIVWIDNNISLEFIYKNSDYTFNCDKNNINCELFNQ